MLLWLAATNQFFVPCLIRSRDFFLRAGFCVQVLVGNGSFFEKYKANERPYLADTGPSPSDAIDPNQALQTL